MLTVQPNDDDFGYIDQVVSEGVSNLERENQINQNMEIAEKDKKEFIGSVHLDAYYKGFHLKMVEGDPSEYDRNNQLIVNAKKRIETMISQGFQPSWNIDTNIAVKNMTENKPEQIAPVCGIHGTPMNWKEGVSQKTGKPYAFWTCPTKNADNSFCSYKPPKT